MSQDARLYITRRFMGQDQAPLGEIPTPDGSSGPRLWVSAPASVQEPHQIQLPDAVEPSSRRNAKPGSCCPALITCWVAGSVTSASARPFNSLATSDSDGFCGST